MRTNSLKQIKRAALRNGRSCRFGQGFGFDNTDEWQLILHFGRQFADDLMRLSRMVAETNDAIRRVNMLAQALYYWPILERDWPATGS